MFEDFRRGKESKSVEREAGKTYRSGELKKKRRFRQTSVSSGTFFSTKILINLILGLAVISTIGLVAYYLIDFVFSW